MKKVKHLFNTAVELSEDNGSELNEALWNLIFYSPKIPNRLHQQQLVEESVMFEVTVNDNYFEQNQLTVQGYKWGNGINKVFLTHGWGSKATDFIDLINLLKTNPDLQIIAFDAPGNGVSEGNLTDLLLYIQSINAIIEQFGIPQVLIGHSLGAMANAILLKQNNIHIPVLISLSPLIKLKEFFISIMCNVKSPLPAQTTFLESFKNRYHISAEAFDLCKLYETDSNKHHLLTYDLNDRISPYIYMEEFLSKNPLITTRESSDIAHEKMHKDPGIISEINAFINKHLDISSPASVPK